MPRRLGHHSRPDATAPLGAASGPARLVGLSVVPTGLCLAHFAGGANNTTASLLFSGLLAVALAVFAVVAPKSFGALRTPVFYWIAGAFLATLAVIGWTLIGLEFRPNPLLAGMRMPRPLTIDRSASIVEAIKLGGLACAFALGCAQGSSLRRAGTTANILAATGATYALAATAAHFSGDIQAGNRLAAGFGSSNSAATVFAMTFVLIVALLLRHVIAARKEGQARSGSVSRDLAFLGLGACAVLVGTALVLTLSRMGLAVSAIALLFLAVSAAMFRPSASSFAFVAWLVVALLFCAAWIGADLLSSRLLNVNADASNRGVIFAEHWRAFLASPTFGYGLGSFTTINSVIMTPETFGALSYIRAAHNVYIQWLEEAGIVGALPMFACLALLIGSVVVVGGRIKSADRLVLLGFIAADLVILLHGVMDYALQVPSIAAAWAFMLGLQFAMTQAWLASEKSGGPGRGRRLKKRVAIEDAPAA